MGHDNGSVTLITAIQAVVAHKSWKDLWLLVTLKNDIVAEVMLKLAVEEVFFSLMSFISGA